MKVTYRRTFRISAAHFNDEATYQAWWRIRDTQHTSDLAFSDIRDCVHNVHGHDYLIEVEARGFPVGNGWVVDDQEVERLVRYYDRANLSTHPDFHQRGEKKRATTENFALLLWDNLKRVASDVLWTVRVFENSDVSAEVIGHDT